jgi:two-component system CheB/CheR fusion protein
MVRPEVITFPIDNILDRLRDEFTDEARAQSLELTVIPCGLSIRSDPRLLEQMMRNLLANALKYTPKGRVLVGCRRHGGSLSVETWDTGVGIAEKDLEAIFEEYHQVDNAARERSRGLGLGLSIVQSLGNLLGHAVRVRSRPGKGSSFAIEVARSERPAATTFTADDNAANDGADDQFLRRGKVLVIEDDPDVQELLVALLKDAGHGVAIAADGDGAMDFIASGGLRPDVLLADYNLPNAMTGLEVIDKIRARLHHRIPAVILTGDISAETLREVALHDCIQLNKPVKPGNLTQLIQDLLPVTPTRMPAAGWDAEAILDRRRPTVFVVDDNMQVREGIRSVLEEDGRTVRDFASSEAFLDAFEASSEGCLLIDAYLPGLSGVALLQRLHSEGRPIPAIMITGGSDVSIAVEAMKAGAIDFIEKPIAVFDLLASVDRALEHAHDASKLFAWRADAALLVDGLTPRQREVMDLVLAGHPSKNIAADLGISQRTVETHRASIMKKTGSKSLPALARMALAAASNAAIETDAPSVAPVG